MSGKARWPDSCAKDTNRRDGEPAVAPRLVPGAKLSSSRDGNSRPRGPTSGRRRQAQPEKGAPRSTTREDTTRSIVASPPHFDASSLSVQTVCRPARQQRQGRCPASHRVAHRRPAAGCVAQRPRRCRSRRLTEPLRQLALRYRRPPPIPGYYRGRAERRARRCGAGSGFYSASGTISPIYGRSKEKKIGVR